MVARTLKNVMSHGRLRSSNSSKDKTDNDAAAKWSNADAHGGSAVWFWEVNDTKIQLNFCATQIMSSPQDFSYYVLQLLLYRTLAILVFQRLEWCDMSWYDMSHIR